MTAAAARGKEAVLVAERIRVREIDDDQGQRLLRIIRRGSGSVVTWRRAQMVLLSVQGMPVAKSAEVTFTSADRARTEPLLPDRTPRPPAAGAADHPPSNARPTSSATLSNDASTASNTGAASPPDTTRPQPSTSPDSTSQASSSGPHDDQTKVPRCRGGSAARRKTRPCGRLRPARAGWSRRW